MFIDGDFPTEKDCKYHCSPTCHPAQIGPEWKYGCLHLAWPQNRRGDFVPIVNCDGNPKKCEIPDKFIKNLIDGKKRRLANLNKSIMRTKKDLEEYEKLLDNRSIK